MVNIRPISDLHLERYSNREYELKEKINANADIFVFAGDIGTIFTSVKRIGNIVPKKKKITYIFYVAGNHEYYKINSNHMNIKQCNQVINDKVNHYNKTNEKNHHIIFLNNNIHYLQIKNQKLRFIGCTLWTDLNFYGNQKKYIHNGINCSDYQSINNFTKKDKISIHNKSLNFIKKELEIPFDGKTIVITHHLPSKHAIHNTYKNNENNVEFVSRLDYLFKKNIDLWIFGHTHKAINKQIEKTKLICNPMGHGFNKIENSLFNPNFLIQI